MTAINIIKTREALERINCNSQWHQDIQEYVIVLSLSQSLRYLEKIRKLGIHIAALCHEKLSNQVDYGLLAVWYYNRYRIRKDLIRKLLPGVYMMRNHTLLTNAGSQIYGGSQ